MSFNLVLFSPFALQAGAQAPTVEANSGAEPSRLLACSPLGSRVRLVMILGLSQGLCQAPMEVRVCFLWPNQCPTQKLGGALSGLGRRSLSPGSDQSTTKVRAHPGIRNREKQPLVPPRTDPPQDSNFSKVSQAAGLRATGLRLLGCCRVSGEDDVPKLMPSVPGLPSGAPFGDVTSYLPCMPPPDDLPSRTMHTLTGSFHWSCSRLWSLQRQVVGIKVAQCPGLCPEIC